MMAARSTDLKKQLKHDLGDNYLDTRRWKRHLKVYHLIARSEHGLMVQILAGLITYLLLAIYCYEQHNEKVSIKRVRQLRIKIQNELRNSYCNTDSLQNFKEQNDLSSYAKTYPAFTDFFYILFNPGGLFCLITFCSGTNITGRTSSNQLVAFLPHYLFVSRVEEFVSGSIITNNPVMAILNSDHVRDSIKYRLKEF